MTDDNTRWERLAKALTASFESMRRYRDLRHSLIKEYVGPGYTGERRRPKYINKFAEAINAYVTLLIPGEPTAAVESVVQELDSFAFTQQLALQRAATEIHLREKVVSWVYDACFFMGVIRGHMADSGRLEDVGGVIADPGMATLSNISFDDWVVDMAAKSLRSAQYVGDKYRVPMSQFRADVEQGMYDPVVAAKVTPSSRNRYDSQRMSHILNGSMVDCDELEPMVDLCDVWLNDGRVYPFWLRSPITFGIHPEPLVAEGIEWPDTESTPYQTLSFRQVPDSILTISPAIELLEADLLISDISKLVARQARRQKNLTLYQIGSDADAKTYKGAPDGAVVGVSDPKSVNNISTPGADAGSIGFLNFLIQNFNIMDGNVPALMGLGPQAPTLGQENLIQQASNRKIAQMADQVSEGVGRLFRTLAVLMWNDEFRNMSMRFPIPGAEKYSATVEWRANERAGNFWDYNFRCSGWMRGPDGPAQDLQTLMQLLQSVYFPMAQLMASQGQQLNIGALNQRIARLLNKPWVNELVLSDSQPSEGGGEAAVDIRAPNESVRHQVRHNVTAGDEPIAQLHNSMTQMQRASASNASGFTGQVA